MTKPQITETDLHAWVDGQGSFARRAEVEHHLASHPEDANRAQAYRSQKRAVQELFNPVLDEPLPEALRELASRPATAAKHPGRDFLPRWSLQRIAASVLLTLFSGAAGWLAHGQYQQAERVAQAVPLARQAAVAHLVYSPDVRRPVEVSAEHEDQLVTWLSKRMGAPVRAPKLGVQGFELVGGRLLPGNSGPVAQFMYQDASGQRLTLMVSNEIAANHDTAFRFSKEGTVNVFYWIDRNYGYALSAGIDKGALARVASAVYDQLDRK
jgi:anti-sigma factor RsiW